MSLQSIKFAKDTDSDFLSTLKKRVADYFKTKNLSKHANANMVIKTIFMFSLYIVPYLLMLAGVVSGIGAILLMWALMGFGKAGVGLSVMHDANHGAYSKKTKFNDFLSQLTMISVGGSSLNWKIQHNVLHHSFTNVLGMDEDINSEPILRLSPHQKRFKAHRFQFIYAWFLYGIMTLSWCSTKDFRQLARYKRKDLLKLMNATYTDSLIKLVLAKIAYFTVMLVIPMLVVPVAWWVILLGFVTMHYIAGFILACIFQSAHVMPTSEYPEPDENGTLENNWAMHQLLTTANFSPASKIFSWYVGGLNYQIEHHLFPTICHVHYPKLSKIVKTTAQEFGLPYHSQPNFLIALREHGKMLYALGNYDMVGPSAS